MRRIGRWVTGPATLLASMLLSAVFAGAAFAAGVPPYVGSSPKGGKGIDRGQLYQGPTDWTAAIVLLAIVVAAGVILVASIQLRERNARRAAAVTAPVTR